MVSPKGCVRALYSPYLLPFAHLNSITILQKGVEFKSSDYPLGGNVPGVEVSFLGIDLCLMWLMVPCPVPLWSQEPFCYW